MVLFYNKKLLYRNKPFMGYCTVHISIRKTMLRSMDCNENFRVTYYIIFFFFFTSLISRFHILPQYRKTGSSVHDEKKFYIKKKKLIFKRRKISFFLKRGCLLHFSLVGTMTKGVNFIFFSRRNYRYQTKENLNAI